MSKKWGGQKITEPRRMPLASPESGVPLRANEETMPHPIPGGNPFFYLLPANCEPAEISQNFSYRRGRGELGH